MTHAAPTPSTPSAPAPRRPFSRVRLPKWLTPKRAAARTDATYDAQFSGDRISGKQLVEEAFVQLESECSELSAAEARVKAARLMWKQVRASFEPSENSDIRHAITATLWADDTGRMTEDFIACLEDVVEINRRMQQGIDAHPVGDVDPGDIDFDAVLDAAEAEADNPSIDPGPPLELPDEEPEEGFLESARAQAIAAAAYVKDTVKSYTVDPLVDMVEASQEKAQKIVDGAKETAGKIQTGMIVGALILGGVWLSSRRAR